MNFDDLVKRRSCKVMSKLSQPAIYDGHKKVSVMIDLSVEQMGAFDSNGPVRRHEVSFYKSEIPSPKRGQKIETASGVFTLDGSIEGDEHFYRWHINEA